MARNNRPAPGANGIPPINITPSDIVIAVMGITGSGKSTFISHFCTGITPDVNRGLESCTATVGIFRCYDNDIGEFFLVDTPGFDDTNRSDAEILIDITAWLNEAYQQNILLTGIIYLHRIIDVRIGNVAFRNLRMFQQLCGEESLAKVVLATTFWNRVTAADGLAREAELRDTPTFWGRMIQLNATMFRQDGERASGKRIIEHLKQRRPTGTPGMTLAVSEQMVNQGLPLDQTAAGQEMNHQILKMQEDYEGRLTELRHDLKKALAQNNKKWEADIKKSREEHDRRIKQWDQDRMKMQATNEDLKKRLDDSHGTYGHEYTQRVNLLEGLRYELLMMQRQGADAAKIEKLEGEIRTANKNTEALKWKLRQTGCVIL